MEGIKKLWNIFLILLILISSALHSSLSSHTTFDYMIITEHKFVVVTFLLIYNCTCTKFVLHYWHSYFLFWSCATSRTVPSSIPGGVTWDFFRGSFRQNHVPWGRLSLWKWVPGISSGVKAAGAYAWRPTTHVVPNVEMIWGLNLPETPRATSTCCARPLLYLLSIPYIYYLFCT